MEKVGKTSWYIGKNFLEPFHINFSRIFWKFKNGKKSWFFYVPGFSDFFSGPVSHWKFFIVFWTILYYLFASRIFISVKNDPIFSVKIFGSWKFLKISKTSTFFHFFREYSGKMEEKRSFFGILLGIWTKTGFFLIFRKNFWKVIYWRFEQNLKNYEKFGKIMKKFLSSRKNEKI